MALHRRPAHEDTGRSVADAVEAAASALVAVWSESASTVYPRVSPPQLAVLLAIDRRGALRLTELAAEIKAIPSSASRLCDRLEAAGILSRAIGQDDRREVLLELTPQGRALIDDLRAARRERLGAVLDRMSPDDRGALLHGLTAFGDSAAHDGT